MDEETKANVEHSFKRALMLLNSGVFDQQHSGHPLFSSAFIELLILLRNLMYKTERHASRVSFTDDVVQTKHVKDVTDLIRFIRDAVCHPDSNNNYIEPGHHKIVFNVIYGRGFLLQIDDFKVASEYEDDVCVQIGVYRVYMKRHVIRALEEIREKLSPMISL